MSMFNKVSKTFQWGQHTVTMETGEIARQAGGAVMVNIDDTVVLATVVASKSAKPGQDFSPSPLITWKRAMPREKSLAVSSSVRAGPASLRHSPAV